MVHVAAERRFCSNDELLGLSDVETAYLLGIQAWLLVVFGMLGAVLVDAYGVRSTAIVSLAVASVSRGLLTFGRSKQTLVCSLLYLSPFGEVGARPHDDAARLRRVHEARACAHAARSLRSACEVRDLLQLTWQVMVVYQGPYQGLLRSYCVLRSLLTP